MAQCSFCGTEIPQGTGTMFIKKDAKILWFCSSKCEKNMLSLGRKPRNKAWTREAHAAKAAAIAAAAKVAPKAAPKAAKKTAAKSAKKEE